MQRRQSVKSKSHLQRRKSTSSVHSVHLEHIDAVSAQRDAQIAACQAYTRAQNRAVADMTALSPATESTPRRRKFGARTPGQGGPGESIGRQQSVRFIGLCSGRPGSSESRTEHEARMPADTARDPSFLESAESSSSEAIGLNSGAPESTWKAPRQGFRHPLEDAPQIPLPTTPSGYISRLAAGDEYSTPEDDIASGLYPYPCLQSRSLEKSDGSQRLPSLDGSASLGNDKLLRSQSPPALRTRRLLHSEPKDFPHTQVTTPLRTPRSMNLLTHQPFKISFSEPGSSKSTRPTTAGSATARPHMTTQSTPHLNCRTLAKPPKHQNGGPPIPKGLRSTNLANGFGVPPMVSTMDLDKEDTFRYKAKKASRSLKTKLRTLFSYSRSDEQSPSVPIQHVHSQRTYGFEGFDMLLPQNDMRNNPDLQGEIQQVPSGVATLRLPARSIHSIRGSLDSTRSERERKVSDDGSMTSWVHSGPSTLTSQQQQHWRNEWEKQRLSVIKENGAHAPSPSLRRPGLTPELYQYADVSQEDSPPLGFTGKSDRVFSELMKRVQATTDKATQVMEEQAHCALDLTAQVPKVRAARFAGADQPQVHNPIEVPPAGGHEVTPIRSTTAVGSYNNQHTWMEQQKDSLLTPRNRNAGYFEKALVGLRDPAKAGVASMSKFELHSTASSSKPSPDPFTCRPESPTLPVEDIISHTEQGSTAAVEASSHLFRTRSPFRQDLRKSMEEEKMAAKHRAAEQERQILITNTYTRVSEDIDCDSGDYTDSIYSTDNMETVGALIPTVSSNDTVARDVREFLRSRDICQPDGGHRTHSSGSSIDWKTWLSANAAKMASPSPPRPEGIEYVMPTMPQSFVGGHVREMAQIDEDFDDYDDFYEEDYEEHSEMMETGPLTHKPTLPTSPLTAVEPNVVKFTPQQRSAKQPTPPANRPSLYENSSPMYIHTSANGMSRAEPETSQLKRIIATPDLSVPGSAVSSPGLTLAVQRQFGHVSKSGGRVLHYRAFETFGGSEDVVCRDFSYPPRRSGESSQESEAFI